MLEERLQTWQTPRGEAQPEASGTLSEQEREILRAAASFGSYGDFTEALEQKFSFSRSSANRSLRTIHKKLGVSDTFSAVTAALNRGIVTLEELVGNNSPLASLNKLTPSQQSILSCFYDCAIEEGSVSYKRVAERLERNPSSVGNAVQTIYSSLGIYPNLAKLAVVAFAFATGNLTQPAQPRTAKPGTGATGYVFHHQARTSAALRGYAR